MTQDFFRRIDGYNFPWIERSGASLARNASLTIASPAGPGRIESMLFMIAETNLIMFLSNPVTIIIDGVTIFSNAFFYISGGFTGLSFSGPVSGVMIGATYITVELKINLDYESSASVAIQNTSSTDPVIFYLTLIGRRGL